MEYDYTPSNRERSQETERKMMPVHGRNTGQLYANAVRKRDLAKRERNKRQRSRLSEYNDGD